MGDRVSTVYGYTLPYGEQPKFPEKSWLRSRFSEEQIEEIERQVARYLAQRAEQLKTLPKRDVLSAWKLIEKRAGELSAAVDEAKGKSQTWFQWAQAIDSLDEDRSRLEAALSQLPVLAEVAAQAAAIAEEDMPGRGQPKDKIARDLTSWVFSAIGRDRENIEDVLTSCFELAGESDRELSSLLEEID